MDKTTKIMLWFVGILISLAILIPAGLFCLGVLWGLLSYTIYRIR